MATAIRFQTSVFVLIVLGATGCGDDASNAQAPAAAEGRFEAVQTAQADVDQVLRDVCDVSYPASSAPRWQWPATSEPPTSSHGRWMWVNFWATWCHPCVEEMPMLERTLSGSAMDLVLVSADANADDLARFRSEHAMQTPTARLTDSSSLGPTLAAVGFRAPPSLPVHVLVDPSGGVRCVRAGGVEQRHVEQVLGGLGQTARPPRIR